MKGINRVIEYSKNDYTFDLEPISDIHYDDTNFDAVKFKQVIERIAKDKDRYTLLMGDYGSSIYSYPTENRGTLTIRQEFRDDPDKLYNDLTNIFYPIRKKILGVVEGNHDHKIHQRSFHEWVKQFSEELEVPYLTMTALINLKFIYKPTGREDNYKIFCTHGSYAGRKPSGMVNKLMDMSTGFDADIYLAGHAHDINIDKRVVDGIDDNGKRVRATRVFGLCGCFVHGYSLDDSDTITYAEQKMFLPNKVGTLTVSIRPFEGKLNIHA